MVSAGTLAEEMDGQGLPAPAAVVIGVGGLYVAQSVIGGVFFTGLPAVMRESGASLDEIAFILITVLPWSFKFLWSPLVERLRAPHGRPRRSRAVVSGIGAFGVGALAACAFIGPTALAPLAVAMMVASFASATADIATDGYAVENLAAKNRGWGNAAQVGGAYLGNAVGGGVFLILVDHFGWTPATLVMALALAALAVPFLTVRETAPLRSADAPPQSLRAALKRPEVRYGLLLVAVYVVGQKWAALLLGPFLIDAGVSLSTLGVINGVGITVSGLIGAFSGGYLLRRFGAYPIMQATLAAHVVALLGFALCAYLEARSEGAIAALIAAQLVGGGTFALGVTALYSELMGRVSLAQAGVDFTLFQSADAIVSVIGWQITGSFGDRLGYAVCFATAAALGVAALLTLPFLSRRGSALTREAHQGA